MSRNPLARVIDFALATDRSKVHQYVETIRGIYPHLDAHRLARAIINRKSIKCGLIGAVTGVGGMLTLPIAIPADLIATWRVQAAMVVAIAMVFGHQLTDEELRTDIFLIIAGNSAKEALKKFGIEVGKDFTKKFIQKHVTREVMKRIWRVVGIKILTKSGEKSLTSLTKLVPLVGAPIGFGFDYIAARAVGKLAIHYYA